MPTPPPSKHEDEIAATPPKVPRDPALRARFWRLYHRSQGYGRRYIPPGLRLVAGVLLICLGVLGFLPVLGFWMIPLGIAIAALDVKAALLWISDRRFSDKGPPRP